jgi:hypothetical protein
MASKMNTVKTTTKAKTQPEKRTYLSQTDVPGTSVDQAMRVSTALADNYAGGPVTPLAVAQALDMQPAGSAFRAICGASIVYGFTVGGAQADEISLTDLGRRAAMPTVEGDDAQAKREALLKPRIVGEFLRKYNGAKLPPVEIGRNVLLGMGVPRDALDRTYELVSESARSLGLIRSIKGAEYVDLNAVHAVEQTEPSELGDPALGDGAPVTAFARTIELKPGAFPIVSRANGSPARVYITHGKNREMLPQLKELLTFGQFEPCVSVEQESVSRPVPDKVIADMRSCSAAIIHVDAEQKLLSPDGQEVVVLNQNVLIEIGAAMALYGNRFILLVEEGVVLPSNLQGLYRVAYKGKELTYEAAMRLLKVFNEFRSGAVSRAQNAESPTAGPLKATP